MKTYLDCYPCFLRQALRAARLAGASDPQQDRVLREVLALLLHVDLDSPPPVTSDRVHRILRATLGGGDPFRRFKDDSTREALQLTPWLETLVSEARDPRDAAVRLSIAGNIVDVAAVDGYDLRGTVERVLDATFAVDHRQALAAAIAASRQPLYLADNAGETVFDRFLIERFPAPVTYAVKGGPILNDATLEDARAAAIDRVARLVDTGSDAPGTMLERCSPAFRQTYLDADLIVAKGQANYETLSDPDPRLFHLLQVKCPIIARDLGVPTGAIVVHHAAG